MTEKTTSRNASSKRKLRPKKPLSNSGCTEININRKTLVDIIGSWLYATRMIDDAQNIKDIRVIDASLVDNIQLLIYTDGGKQK